MSHYLYMLIIITKCRLFPHDPSQSSERGKRNGARAELQNRYAKLGHAPTYFNIPQMSNVIQKYQHYLYFCLTH